MSCLVRAGERVDGWGSLDHSVVLAALSEASGRFVPKQHGANRTEPTKHIPNTKPRGRRVASIAPAQGEGICAGLVDTNS